MFLSKIVRFFAFVSLFIALVIPLSQNVRAETSARIVGGTTAYRGEFPFVAAILIRGVSPYYGQFCGGSLIDSKWV